MCAFWSKIGHKNQNNRKFQGIVFDGGEQGMRILGTRSCSLQPQQIRTNRFGWNGTRKQNPNNSARYRRRSAFSFVRRRAVHSLWFSFRSRSQVGVDFIARPADQLVSTCKRGYRLVCERVSVYVYVKEEVFGRHKNVLFRTRRLRWIKLVLHGKDYTMPAIPK